MAPQAPGCNYDNLFNISEYNGYCNRGFFGGKPALPEGFGWGIICGLGAAFSVLVAIISWAEIKYAGRKNTSEFFSTAGRTIKSGLTACDIVSKWTWAATLLQSSNVAYKFGVSGPFWYASGATIQVLLFAILAIEIKRKCPTIHTVLEIILARWGKVAHIVFLFFCFCTNIIVTSMLILGGSAVINALTGVDLYAASFIIPIGVILYTAYGGLKATFLSSWINCGIIFLAMCIFMFKIYASDPDLGSPAKVWENLTYQTPFHPIKDNYKGSPLTMFSYSGIVFGIINIIGNFGTVFVDQSYWQSAIAAKPSATYRGYLLGGLCWFAIPFTMATSMGLAARALDLPLTINESNQGLVPPAVALHLLGKGGGFLMALQLFAAVISTASAEQMAVASLVSYDIYRTYFNPKATGKQIVFLSRIMVFVYGVLSGVLAIILWELGLNLGWVYLFMGTIIGSAVFPMAASITWRKCSAFAAITSALVGQWAGIITWLVVTKSESGVVNVETTGMDNPMLAGNVVALFLSAFICIILSLIWPQNYDWAGLRDIPMIEQDGSANLAVAGEDSPEAMDKALKWVYWTGCGLTLILIIVWPCLALIPKTFPKGYFVMWVVIALIWGLFATFSCLVLPIWEERDSIGSILYHMVTCKQPTPPPVVEAEMEHIKTMPKGAA